MATVAELNKALAENKKQRKGLYAKGMKWQRKADTYLNKHYRLCRQEDKLVDDKREASYREAEIRDAAKRLAKLQAALATKKPQFDTRYTIAAKNRLDNTYWCSNYSTRAYAGKYKGKTKYFLYLGYPANRVAARYFATTGKARTKPKVKGVDIAALNKALVNTGYKVVAGK